MARTRCAGTATRRVVVDNINLIFKEGVLAERVDPGPSAISERHHTIF
jgi:hypothetical protein